MGRDFLAHLFRPKLSIYGGCVVGELASMARFIHVRPVERDGETAIGIDSRNGKDRPAEA
jgi:hypothetical protein